MVYVREWQIMERYVAKNIKLNLTRQLGMIRVLMKNRVQPSTQECLCTAAKAGSSSTSGTMQQTKCSYNSPKMQWDCYGARWTILTLVTAPVCQTSYRLARRY